MSNGWSGISRKDRRNDGRSSPPRAYSTPSSTGTKISHGTGTKATDWTSSTQPVPSTTLKVFA